MILFDTAPIVAAAFRSEEHYEVCTELFTGLRLAGRQLLLPATVAAEVGYMLDDLVVQNERRAFSRAWRRVHSSWST